MPTGWKRCSRPVAKGQMQQTQPWRGQEQSERPKRRRKGDEMTERQKDIFMEHIAAKNDAALWGGGDRKARETRQDLEGVYRQITGRDPHGLGDDDLKRGIVDRVHLDGARFDSADEERREEMFTQALRYYFRKQAERGAA